MWEYLTKRLRVDRRGSRESGDVHRVSTPGDPSASAAIDSDHAPNQGERPVRSTPARSRRLACPACQTPMELRYIGKTEVDACPGCGGVFLDRGELRELQGDHSSYEHRSVDPPTHLIYTPHGLSRRVTEDHHGGSAMPKDSSTGHSNSES